MGFPKIEDLQAVDTAISMAFHEGQKQRAADDLNLIATITRSTRSKQSYPFLQSSPQFRKWVGDRVIQGVDDFKKYELVNEDWEVTIGIPVNDIADDEWGVYVDQAKAIGPAYERYKARLVYKALKNGNAADALCFDGLPFFSASHPVGDGTQSNYTSGANPPWVIIDDTGMKPIVFQERQDLQLVPKINPSDDNIFFNKMAIWGANARFSVGYGMWQTAHQSRADLTEDNLNAALLAMQSLTDKNGEVIGLTPNLLVCGPALQPKAMKLLSATTMANGATNVMQGMLKLHVSPFFA